MEHSTQINQDEILKQTTEAFSQREKENITFHELCRLQTLFDKLDEFNESEQTEDINELKLALSTYFAIHWKQTTELSKAANTFLESYFKDILSNEEIEATTHLALSINTHTAEKSNQETILYDIYWSFLGEKKIVRNIELLSIEIHGNESQKVATFQSFLDVISTMKFLTEWAVQQYSARKSMNTRKLLQAIEKGERKKKKKIRRSQKLGRGIETMYRSIYRNHINLSSIADAKANLIIRVNTIIMSIIITLGGTGYTFYESGFFKYARFTVPVILLLLGALGAVIFAVLSARPKVTNNEVSQAKIRGNESSILFFGNYINLDKKDFIREMSLFRRDKKRVYDNMSVDIYYLGLVLDKKYRLVTISYNIFMLGIALSVLSFIIIFSYTQVYLPNAG